MNTSVAFAVGLSVAVICAVLGLAVYVAAVALTPPPASLRDALVVTDYNPAGGYGWNLYNVLCAWRLARRAGLRRLVVYFRDGPYHETRAHHSRAWERSTGRPLDAHNSFFNLFPGPEGWARSPEGRWCRRVLCPGAWGRLWPALGARCCPRVLRWEEEAGPGSGPYLFDRSSLKSLPAAETTCAALAEAWLEGPLRAPRPFVERRVALVTARLAERARSQDPVVYAVHYRGTDKFPHSGRRDPSSGEVTDVSWEDAPEHPTHEFVLRVLREEVARGVAHGWHAEDQGFAVFVASDEAPFIEAMQRARPALPVEAAPGVLRSAADTAGLELDTRLCGEHRGADRTSPECRRLHELVEASVHRGHRAESGARKAQELLVDALLLARGRVFLRSRGNASNLATYVGRGTAGAPGPMRRVVDLAERWRRARRRRREGQA